ncbi:MAG TPA: OmpW family outer membrane protein [Burkholderiaceae bacterium]|jgi:outer membrane protein|nr:OmpW family outer membrane protein [Burkholderiaceae bacterium]
MKVRILAAAVAAMSLAGAAQAKDAAHSRFAVTAGFASQHLGGDKPLNVTLTDAPAGGQVENDRSDEGATLGFSWFINRNIAIELWGASRFDASTEIDMENAPDVGVSKYRTRPLALTAQYHFTQLGDRFKPYVGLGVHRTRVDGEWFNPALDGAHDFRIDDGTGLAATVGLDVNLPKHWFVRGDVRYLRWNSDVRLDNLRSDVDMHSLVYGVSAGLRF